jgi:hypothetical protein
MNGRRIALALGLLLAGCTTISGAGGETNTIPPRPAGACSPNWEHMCINPAVGTYSQMLNEAGAQGWEMVLRTEQGTYCFKRPVASPPSSACPPAPPGGDTIPPL